MRSETDGRIPRHRVTSFVLLAVAIHRGPGPPVPASPGEPSWTRCLPSRYAGPLTSSVAAAVWTEMVGHRGARARGNPADGGGT